MTMAQQVLVAEVGMIRTARWENWPLKTRLDWAFPVSEAECREVTANVSRNGANAIMVEGTPEAMTNRALIANLIGAAGLPAIHTIPKFVDAGHLMAYSIDVAALNKRAANNIDAILRRSIKTRSSSFPSTSRPRRRLASTSRQRSTLSALFGSTGSCGDFRFRCKSGPRKFYDRRGIQFYCLFA
jgi:hypothetical protein